MMTIKMRKYRTFQSPSLVSHYMQHLLLGTLLATYVSGHHQGAQVLVMDPETSGECLGNVQQWMQITGWWDGWFLESLLTFTKVRYYKHDTMLMGHIDKR